MMYAFKIRDTLTIMFRLACACLDSISSCGNNALDEDIVIEPAWSTTQSKVWVKDDYIPSLRLPAFLLLLVATWRKYSRNSLTFLF